MSLQLPTQAATIHLMAGLLCKPITAKPAAAPFLASPGPRVIGLYVDDKGAVGSLWMCDVAAGAYLGAALSLIGPAVAAEAHKTGRLNEGLLENLREVVNVAASLFNVTGGGHVRLRDVLVPPAPIPADVVALANVKKNRTDLDITVPGYGAGKLSFILV
ncbi:MAG: hypothetical protein U0235_15035 [Polyangiaceae bacterium]